MNLSILANNLTMFKIFHFSVAIWTREDRFLKPVDLKFNVNFVLSVFLLTRFINKGR